MNNNGLERVASDRALVNDAPSGHHPSGFDPSRVEESYFRCGHPRTTENSAVHSGGRRRCRHCLNEDRRSRAKPKRDKIKAAIEELRARLIQRPGITCRVRKEHLALALKALTAEERRHWGHLRDSDGSGEASETRSGSTVGDSADPKGIAQPPTKEPTP